MPAGQNRRVVLGTYRYIETFPVPVQSGGTHTRTHIGRGKIMKTCTLIQAILS